MRYDLVLVVQFTLFLRQLPMLLKAFNAFFEWNAQNAQNCNCTFTCFIF